VLDISAKNGGGIAFFGLFLDFRGAVFMLDLEGFSGILGSCVVEDVVVVESVVVIKRVIIGEFVVIAGFFVVVDCLLLGRVRNGSRNGTMRNQVSHESNN